MSRPVEEIAAEFWAKVQKGEGCWLWTGRMSRKGYGEARIRLHGKLVHTAHRVALTLASGQSLPPWPMVVMHSCDVRACCNPAHLSLGTQTENVADQDRKGGAHRARGKQHGRAKLTEADVLYIRSSSESDSVLGRRYGVFSTTIAAARTGKKWGHLPGATGPLPTKRKLTPDQVREIRRRRAAGEMTKNIAKDYGISQPTASMVARRTLYRHVE
jgi:hypothetical protein